MVSIRARPEGVAGVEAAVERDVEVVLAHELAKVGRAEVVAALAEGVIEVEGVESELVGHRDVAVVGDAARDPVVTAHGLHPPDLVDVAERDAVVLVGPVALEKAAQHPDAVAGGAHVGEHEGDHVLLADAAYDLGLVVLLARRALCGPVLDERVGAEHALVGGERLGGAHAHVADREARLLPEAALAVGVGKRGVATPALGQGDGEVRDDARVRGLARGVDDDELLRLEGPAGGVLVAGDDGGPVVAGVPTDQDGGAGHGSSSGEGRLTNPWYRESGGGRGLFGDVAYGPLSGKSCGVALTSNPLRAR